MNFRDLAFTAAMCSHVLAWTAFVLLIFVPVYRGESVTPESSTVISGDVISNVPAQVTTSHTATIISVNGLGVIPIMLAPVAISTIGLLGVILAGPGRSLRRAPLGISALLLLGFCVAGSYSIGMFYLPAALAMAVSAALGYGQKKERAVSS